LQEVVVLLSKLITQIGLILTSKAEHLFGAFGIKVLLQNRINKIIDFIVYLKLAD